MINELEKFKEARDKILKINDKKINKDSIIDAIVNDSCIKKIISDDSINFHEKMIKLKEYDFYLSSDQILINESDSIKNSYGEYNKILIDRDILDIIQEINDKKIKTLFSCGGHLRIKRSLLDIFSYIILNDEKNIKESIKQMKVEMDKQVDMFFTPFYILVDCDVLKYKDQTREGWSMTNFHRTTGRCVRISIEKKFTEKEDILRMTGDERKNVLENLFIFFKNI